MKKIKLHIVTFVVAALTLLFNESKASVFFSGESGFTIHVRIYDTYQQYGSNGTESYIQSWDETLGEGDSTSYIDSHDDGGYYDANQTYIWWSIDHNYDGYVFWEEPVSGGDDGGGGNNGGGGTLGVGFTPSKTIADVGESIDFHVTAFDNEGGLSFIGLELCNNAGTPVENRGEVTVNGNSADNIFAVGFDLPGTYYFDSYLWSADHTRLLRSEVRTVTISGGGGGGAVPDDPSNLIVQSDGGSAFLSWQNPGTNFGTAIVVWTTDGDFNTALNDPNRHAETTNGYYTIEGLNNGTTYQVLVLSHGPGGFSNGTTSGTVTPNIPLGYAYAIDNELADTALETATSQHEQFVITIEKTIRQVSSEIGFSLRAVLQGLNAALATIGNTIEYEARVHEAARHIASRIVREAWLKGEITVEQAIAITAQINALQLPPVGAAQGEAEYNVKLATDAANGGIAQAKTSNQNLERTSVGIYRFGNATRVSPARPIDFSLPVGSPGSTTVQAQDAPLPDGASCFGDVYQSTLNGPYWLLPEGTVIPPELGIVADGSDVNPFSDHGPTHYTIYPRIPMSLDLFNGLMRSLPWIRAGTK